MNMETAKRNVKEAAIAREAVYAFITDATVDAIDAIAYEFVGRATEGLIYRDIDADTYVVVKAVAKGLEFDAEDAMAEFEEKAAKAIEKVAKAKAKAEKDIAKRAKDKAEAEVVVAE